VSWVSLNKNGNNFRDEIFKTGERLTSTMDRMKENLKHNDDLRIKLALKASASAQSQLLKAYFSLDPSNEVPLVVGESFEHFIAKNNLVKKLSVEDVSDEVPLGGGCVVDVVGRIGKEYVIIETETIPTKCIEKTGKIKNAIVSILSGETMILEEGNDPIFPKIKKQIEARRPMRLIFAVTRKPYLSTLDEIRKAGNSTIRPEVYHVNRLPPFKISPNLLKRDVRLA
jgi:hypothetical protein